MLFLKRNQHIAEYHRESSGIIWHQSKRTKNTSHAAKPTRINNTCFKSKIRNSKIKSDPKKVPLSKNQKALNRLSSKIVTLQKQNEELTERALKLELGSGWLKQMIILRISLKRNLPYISKY
jgi:hypothetical protein